MKKRIKILIVSIISFALVLTAVTAFAMNFKSIKTVKNDFNPAEAGIAVQENNDDNSNPTPNVKNLEWEEDSVNQVYTAEKEVKILNNENNVLNSAPVFIRVSIVPRWTATINGTDIDVTNTDSIGDIGSFAKEIQSNSNSYTMGDVKFILDESWRSNWIYGNDGYFYCRTAVHPGETTPLLLKSVSITAEKYSKIPNDTVLKVDVVADSIQTEGQDSGETSALKERWGIPEELGIQVEKDENGSLILEEYIAN